MYYGQWASKIEELEGDTERELELYFVYAVIVRKIFLYDYVPDSLNDDLKPIEIWPEDEDNSSTSLFTRNKSLKASLEQVADDAEIEAFLKQYTRYSRFIGIALANAVQDFSE